MGPRSPDWLLGKEAGQREGAAGGGSGDRGHPSQRLPLPRPHPGCKEQRRPRGGKPARGGVREGGCSMQSPWPAGEGAAPAQGHCGWLRPPFSCPVPKPPPQRGLQGSGRAGGAGDGGISTNKFDSYSVTVEKPCLLQEHYFLDKCLIKNLIEQWCLTDTGCKGIGEALSSSSSVAAGNI